MAASPPTHPPSPDCDCDVCALVRRTLGTFTDEEDLQTFLKVLPRGVWRRGPSDWAYRIEIKGHGSVAGVGFSSRDEARQAMLDARKRATS